MPVMINHQLQEEILHKSTEFPITYFQDELVSLPERSGPLHWHPDFEILTAKHEKLDCQIGGKHVILEAGDSIFINRNVMHGIKQLSGDNPDPMPNIVFSGALIAPETSTIYKKFIHPIAQCEGLPYVVFSHNEEMNNLIKDVYKQMENRQDCYELSVQRNINKIFEFLFKNLNLLPKTQVTRIQINHQIRLQKMLSFIYENYEKIVTLEDIAKAAAISRSEAGRCFHSYMGCSPIDALIQYRLQIAYHLLHEGTQTLQQISDACGFNSVNYFSRQFKKIYGHTPSEILRMGK